jgi:uncharacterized membrane protein
MHIGHIHPMIVHFPIALAVGAVVAEFLCLVTRRPFFRSAALYCLAGALITAPPVVLTGYLLKGELEPTFDAPTADLAEDHEDMGYATLGVIIGACVVRLAWWKRPVKWLGVLYALMMVALVVFISITADYGGELTYGPDWVPGIFK